MINCMNSYYFLSICSKKAHIAPKKNTLKSDSFDVRQTERLVWFYK